MRGSAVRSPKSPGPQTFLRVCEPRPPLRYYAITVIRRCGITVTPLCQFVALSRAARGRLGGGESGESGESRQNFRRFRHFRRSQRFVSGPHRRIPVLRNYGNSTGAITVIVEDGVAVGRTRIDEVPLTTRARNALANEGIEYVDEIANLDLDRLYCVGEKTSREIRNAAAIDEDRPAPRAHRSSACYPLHVPAYLAAHRKAVEAKRLREQGWTYKAIGARLGVSGQTCKLYIDKLAKYEERRVLAGSCNSVSRNSA